MPPAWMDDGPGERRTVVVVFYSLQFPAMHCSIAMRCHAGSFDCLTIPRMGLASSSGGIRVQHLPVDDSSLVECLFTLGVSVSMFPLFSLAITTHHPACLLEAPPCFPPETRAVSLEFTRRHCLPPVFGQTSIFARYIGCNIHVPVFSMCLSMSGGTCGQSIVPGSKRAAGVPTMKMQ